MGVTELRANVTFPSAAQYCVIAEDPAPAVAVSAQKYFTVMAAVSLTISPTTATIRGGSARQFVPTVRNTSMREVDWLVNGIAGGDATTGLVATDGTYTAPMNIAPVNGSVKVRARSKKDPNAFAEATVTLQNPVPLISSVKPTRIPLENASFSITGNGFAAGATVNLGGTAMTATVVSTTQINVTGVTKPVPDGIAGLITQSRAGGHHLSAANS